MTEAWFRTALERKRDGRSIAPDVWARIVDGYCAGTIDESPVAALMMACAIRGLDDDETFALTDAMIRSGDTLHFDGIVVDKHSSGGVGDAVSLAVVPIVAACGVRVAKLSGRALGHTGGTLDKFESIAGVRTDLSSDEFRAQVDRIGCAIAAQTARLVPADKRLYDLRDRTGTVTSIGLIAASIVSKKIAGGATAVVFDVKLGGGAFMRTVGDATHLADVLVKLTRRFGRRGAAVVTDMDEPLAPAIGNALEAIEARDFLRGIRRDARLAEVIGIVAGEMLLVAGVSESELAPRLARVLADGSAYAKLVELVEAQGGSQAALEALSVPPVRAVARASRSGYVGSIDAVELGELSRSLLDRGGNGAGVIVRKRIGDVVRAGDVLAELVGIDGDASIAEAAYRISETAPVAHPILAAVIRDAVAASSSKRASE